MEKLSVGQRKLIAEFLSNIGVAWFVAGVISRTAIPFVWGLAFSSGFLRLGLFFTKGIKS